MIEINMLLNGVDTNITGLCSSIEISGSLTSICRQATVNIEIGIYNKTFPNLIFPDFTPLWIKDINEDGSLKEGLFSGIIVDYSKNSTQYQVTCFDYAYYLSKSKVTKNFSSITAEDATKEILNELGVEANYLYPSRINISKLYAQQSAYDVIMDLYTQVYKQTGYKFFLSANYWNKIGVYRVNWHKCEKIITPNVGNTNVSNGNLLSLDYKKTGSNVINRVKVYDDKNQLIETMDNEECSFGQFGILQEEYVQEEGKDYPTVVRNSIFHGIDKDISVEVLGNYDYYSGSEVKICVPWIEDLKQKDDGSYVSAYITSDTQSWDCSTGSYTTKLEITLTEFMDEKYIDDATETDKGTEYDSGDMVENAVQWAIDIANDDSHGYTYGAWGPDNYDCAHFVITAFEQAGIKLKSSGATYTGDLKEVAKKLGFKVITKWNKDTGEGLKRGDILLNEAKHAEIYIGSGQMVGARTDEVAKPDQIQVHKYKDNPWDCALRFPESKSKATGKSYSGGWSEEFCKWVESWEGFRANWYDDGGGTLTIGIGTAVTSDLGKQLRANGVESCTEEEAINWMIKEMESWWSEIKKWGGDSLPTNQQYFMCDYCYQYGYNNGKSKNICSMLISGNVDGVCDMLGSGKRNTARKTLLKKGTYKFND